MTATLLVATTHHILAFALVATLALEFATLGRRPTSADIRAVGRLDMAYGAVFFLLLVVGFLRALYLEKGWDYYSESYAFWSKLGLYLLAAAISVKPTVLFIRWNRALSADPFFLPDEKDVAAVRRLMAVQAALLIAIPLFAAMMARGIWSFSF